MSEVRPLVAQAPGVWVVTAAERKHGPASRRRGWLPAPCGISGALLASTPSESKSQGTEIWKS